MRFHCVSQADLKIQSSNYPPALVCQVLVPQACVYYLLTWLTLSCEEPSLYISVTTRASACLSTSISWTFAKSSKYLTSQNCFPNTVMSSEFSQVSAPSVLSSSANSLLAFSGELLHVMNFLLRFNLLSSSLAIFSFRKCFLVYFIFCKTGASWSLCGIKQLERVNEAVLFCTWPTEGRLVSWVIEDWGENLMDPLGDWVINDLGFCRRRGKIFYHSIYWQDMSINQVNFWYSLPEIMRGHKFHIIYDISFFFFCSVCWTNVLPFTEPPPS